MQGVDARQRGVPRTARGHVVHSIEVLSLSSHLHCSRSIGSDCDLASWLKGMRRLSHRKHLEHCEVLRLTRAAVLRQSPGRDSGE